MVVGGESRKCHQEGCVEVECDRQNHVCIYVDNVGNVDIEDLKLGFCGVE